MSLHCVSNNIITIYDYRDGGYLFTLVAKSLKTQAGVPVAFLMIRKLDAEIIVGWLEALKQHIRSNFKKDYSPSVVVMDMGATEYNVIRKVFPEAKVFYCAFHVLQAWQRNIKDDNNLNLVGAISDVKKATRQRVI